MLDRRIKRFKRVGNENENEIDDQNSMETVTILWTEQNRK